MCPKRRKSHRPHPHTDAEERRRRVRHTNQVGNCCFHHSPRLYISPSAFVQRDEIKTGVRGMLSHLWKEILKKGGCWLFFPKKGVFGHVLPTFALCGGILHALSVFSHMKYNNKTTDKPQTTHFWPEINVCTPNGRTRQLFFKKNVHMLPFPTFSGRNRRYIWTTGQLSLEGEAGRKKRGKKRRKFANCQKISSCSSKRKKLRLQRNRSLPVKIPTFPVTEGKKREKNRPNMTGKDKKNLYAAPNVSLF